MCTAISNEDEMAATFAAVLRVWLKATVTDALIAAYSVDASGRCAVADSTLAFICVCRTHATHATGNHFY